MPCSLSASSSPTGTTASSTTPKRQLASASACCESWPRTASRWWPLTCRSHRSVMWQAPAMPSVASRPYGSINDPTALKRSSRCSTESEETTMRAIRVIDASRSLVQLDAEAVQPAAGAGEVLIHVAAAGLTPSELSWDPTIHQRTGKPRTGAIPGHEFSGVVAAVGESVGHLAVGHMVFGMNDWYSDGAMADYCTAPLFALAPKPSSLSLTEAA